MIKRWYIEIANNMYYCIILYAFTIAFASVTFMTVEDFDFHKAVWFSFITSLTIGYGDVSPGTPLGKFLSVLLMLAGYAIIAVPTGIVTAEMRNKRQNLEKVCDRCGNEDIDDDSRYCKICGEKVV